MSYAPTKRGNPCIHCGDTRGNCRTHKTREMHLCVSLAGSRAGEKSQGYVVIGDTDDGRWSQLLPDNGKEYSSEKIRELRLEWQRLEEQAKRSRLAGEMPAVERDKHYREILAQLGLNSEDKADLVRRGFTEEQIIKSGFKSVERWQKLNNTYPGNLPGINSRGDGLISHTPGYVCPIRDVDGLIVGLQVRKRVLVGDDNQRYYFLSTDSNIRLNDQIPLAVFPGERPGIGLVEGVGVKPFLACDRLGISIIGAAGANWASSADHFKNAIKERGAKPGDTVTIFPDAGSVKNISVVHQYIRIAKLLQSCGYGAQFAWWGQVDKFFGDIDELSPEKYESIYYLSVAEFKALCVKLGGLIPPGTGFCQVKNKKLGEENTNGERILQKVRTSENSQINGETFTNREDIESRENTSVDISGQGRVIQFPSSGNSTDDRRFQGDKKATKATRIDRENVAQFDYQERVAEAQRKLHTLSYPVDLVCDPSKKYLPDLVGLIPTRGSVNIKAAKGSGKSHQIKLIKDHCCGYWSEIIIPPVPPELPPDQLELLAKENKNKQEESAPQPQIKRVFHKGLGMKFLSINARIALGREQAVRWEFTWIEDADLEAKTEFEGTKLSSASIIENIGEIGLCWDSLGKIFSRDWSNTLVVIDEIELGLNHVSTSSTCRDRRSFILHTLEHKLRECLDNGGLVITADADLTDSSLDYLTAIAPGHPPFIVSHDFKGDPWEINFYTGKRDTVLSEIEEWLSDKDCRPIAIAVDNQTEVESVTMALTKKYPWLAQEIGGIVRIDSKITQTDYGKNFVKHVNENIKKYQPKALFYTPSLGVGCSIDIEYFARVFGLFFGNVEPSQARQALARVRQAVPRTVWSKDRASNSENEATSHLPEEIKRRMFDYNDGFMTTMLEALTKAKQIAQDTGIVNPEDKDILPYLIETLQAMMGSDGSWNNPHLDLYCQQVARRNFALNQFALQLRQELIDEGHHVKDIRAEEKNSTGDAVKAEKEEIKTRNATATARALDITYEEAQEVKRKPVRTEAEEHSMAKAFLKNDLPGVELTPQFVLKAKYENNGRWLSQAKLFWYIYNADALKDRDEREWRYRLNQFSKGVAFLPDVKTYTPKVSAIIKSGVLEWIEPGDLETEYSNESAEGQAFVKRCYVNRKLIKTALNITVHRDSEPIKLANRILDRIGLALAYSRRDQQGDRIRYYKLDEELATDSDRQSVWDALNQRWRERFSSIAETPAQHEKNSVQFDSNSLYKNESSGRENKPEEMPLAHVLQEVTNSQQVPTDENMAAAATPRQQEVLNISTTEIEQWNQPETIADVAQMLQSCEDLEMLTLLRQCNIPAEIFKIAARQLPSQKREQIRCWVKALKRK